ncbi:MAG TPA: metalloregulator ArsR/SmtB family transcription factor [Rhizomicrobium sp.]|jgi:DNA-binding transcriptional ArsR family regulator|nr:metalloregulator ArsR/SmtB family transcription factor [Rhizomicrobium sp.]
MNLDHTFAALADPTRRAILARLALGEATVGELSAPFPISGPAISRHLRVLEEAALIERQKDGQHRRIRLAPAAMAGAAEWIEAQRAYWSGTLDRLNEHLKKTSQDGGGTTHD